MLSWVASTKNLYPEQFDRIVRVSRTENSTGTAAGTLFLVDVWRLSINVAGYGCRQIVALFAAALALFAIAAQAVIGNHSGVRDFAQRIISLPGKSP